MSIYRDIENLIESLEYTDSTHEVDAFARDTARRLREILVEARDSEFNRSDAVQIVVRFEPGNREARDAAVEARRVIENKTGMVGLFEKAPHSDGSNMVRIEGPQLESLLAVIDSYRVDGMKIRHVRVDQRGDSLAFKVNEGTWSPGLGVHQPPY